MNTAKCAALSAMCALLVSGCSKKDASEAASTGGASSGDKSNTLVVWSFTDEIENLLNDYYKPVHPDVEIEYGFTPFDQFTSKLDPVLASGNGAPDVFGLEDAFVRKYVESGLLLPLDDIYAEVKDKMADYPMKVGSYNGHVYGMAWQVTPGALFYRRSLAKKYLGTDDPVEVQKLMSDEGKFIDLAKTLKERSNGKCVTVSNASELSRPYTMGARKKPWVVDDKLYIDPAMERYMDMCKLFHDERYDARVAQSSEGWYAGLKGALKDDEGNPLEVFCTLLPTWGLHFVLKPNAGDTAGDWGMCKGPYNYRSGGTWLAAYKGTKNPEGAKEMIKYMATDDTYLEQYVMKSGDVVGNINVQNKVKDSYSEPFLGGQNHYAQFCEMAKSIDGGLTQASDQAIEALFSEAVTAYSLGEKSKEDALAGFKEQVATMLGF